MTANALWLIGGKVYQMIVNLVVSMLMARYLGPANYGLINYAASFTALFTSICTLGINSILVNELLQKPQEQGTILGSAIGLRLCSSGLCVATIVALAWALNPTEPTTVQVVLIYSTTLIFQSFDCLNYWYQSNLQSKTAAIIASVGYTAATIYKIYLLVTAKSVQWFAASHVVEFALVAVLLAVSYCKSKDRLQPLRFSARTGKALLKNSYHFILSGLMVALYGQMDKIMIKAMLNDTAVGYYSAAVAICSMWPFVLQAVIDSAKPVIILKFNTSREAFETNLICLYGTIIYVSLAAAGMITLLSKYIILILYGEAYLGARTALCIVCWYTVFSYLGVARSIWLVPQGMQKYEKYIAASGAVCNLLLNAVLIPAWGINGAALATLITQFFTNFIVGFFIGDIRRNNVLILRGFCFWRYLKTPRF